MYRPVLIVNVSMERHIIRTVRRIGIVIGDLLVRRGRVDLMDVGVRWVHVDA